METLEVTRRWSMADRCLWPTYCAQDRAGESGDYCYYHFKLVEGQIDVRTTTKKTEIARAVELLARAGAVPGAVARTSTPEPPIPFDKKHHRKGKIKQGTLRMPRRPK